MSDFKKFNYCTIDPKKNPENGLVPLGLAMLEPEKDSVFPFTQESAHDQPSPDNKCELCNKNFKTPANAKKHVRIKHASPTHMGQRNHLMKPKNMINEKYKAFLTTSLA